MQRQMLAFNVIIVSVYDWVLIKLTNYILYRMQRQILAFNVIILSVYDWVLIKFRVNKIFYGHTTSDFV